MKRLIRIGLGVLAVVVLGVGGLVATVDLRWPIVVAVHPTDLKVEATPARVARGKKLANIRCAQCHYDQKTKGFTGRLVAGEPEPFGVNYSANITRHPTLGTGRYTDGELAVLLRTGVERDGRYPGPYMISPTLADEDIYSLIAFLRSDDPWVAAQDVQKQPSRPGFMLKLLAELIVPPGTMPGHPIPLPPEGDQVAQGRYLVTAVGDCFVCHSESFRTLNSKDPTKSGGYMAGGNEVVDARGVVVRGANLTFDRETGIGGWSEAQFVRAVRTGFDPEGRPLRYPMTPFPDLTEKDAEAIYAYLKTLTPVHHAIERNIPPAPAPGAVASSGEEIYRTYQCTSCHGDNGLGICDLRGAGADYPTDAALEAFIREPSRFVPGTKMPTWSGVLQDASYRPLIAYIRSLQTAGGAKP